MPRIIQALMFLLKWNREDICEPHSNRLFWKSARTQFNQLPRKMVDYQMLGANDCEFKGYQTINYCEKLINDYHQEDVDHYQISFGKLFKWLTGAIALRKQDIIRRKAITKRDTEFREEKIKEKQTRAENRETFLLEASEKFAADNADAIEAHARYQRAT